jgi:hypothetical protein
MKRKRNKRVGTLDLPGKDFVAINEVRDSYCRKGLKNGREMNHRDLRGHREKKIGVFVIFRVHSWFKKSKKRAPRIKRSSRPKS